MSTQTLYKTDNKNNVYQPELYDWLYQIEWGDVLLFEEETN